LRFCDDLALAAVDSVPGFKGKETVSQQVL
jgi:hypothetical protein